MARTFSNFISSDLKLCMHTSFIVPIFKGKKENLVPRSTKEGAQVKLEPVAWLASHCLKQNGADLFIVLAPQM